MASTDFPIVDEYLAAQPESARGVLERVRKAIRMALPDAEEKIAYQMPAYKMPGGDVIYFAGWKQHYSVYPATAVVIAALQNELARYELSKGTIRFPYAEAVPVRLLIRIARLRAREVADRAKKKRATATPKVASNILPIGDTRTTS